MTKKFIQKNIKLSLEFDSYLSKHPDLIAKIPNGAHVIITVKGDTSFNKSSKSLVERRHAKKAMEARKEGSKWILEPLAA